MKLAPAAGRKLSRNDILVSQFGRAPGIWRDNGNPVVEQVGDRRGDNGKPSLLVLSDFGNHEVVKETLLVWKHTGGLQFTLKDCFHADLPEQDLSRLVTALVRNGALQRREPQHWLKVDGSLCSAARALESLGFARCETLAPGDLYCCILDHSLRSDVLISSWALSDPQPALALRIDIALQDRTSWELLQILHDQGWSWAPWRSPLTISNKKNVSPIGYAPGDAKKIYSSPVSQTVICHYYLRALLSAEELCLRLANVPHGRPSSHYKVILDGGDLPPWKCAALCDGLRPDIETEPKTAARHRSEQQEMPEAEHVVLALEDEGMENVEEDAENAEDYLAELEAELEGLLFSDPPPHLDIDAGVPEDEILDMDEFLLALTTPPEPPLPPPSEAPNSEQPSSSSSGSAGAAVAAVPPPPPPYEPAFVAKQFSGVRVRHTRFECDIRGDGKAHLKHDTVLNKLAAHCCHPDHGDNCRMGRTLTADARGRNLGQGSPLGFLIAWMQAGDDFHSGPDHMNASHKPQVVLDLRWDFATRVMSRTWGADNCPDWAALLELEAGDGLEPEDVQ